MGEDPGGTGGRGRHLTGKGISDAADSEVPAEQVGPVRRLARVLFSIYAWALVLLNALANCAVAFASEPFIGTEAAWIRAQQWWTRLNLALALFRVRVEGLEKVPVPAVIAAIHQGSFDINVLALALPRPFHFVARVEVLAVPIVGTALRRARHILIRRGGGAANDEAMREAEERLRRGSRVIFFPEGTRSEDGSIRPFRSGAFRLAARTGCPLVPAVISGTRMANPKGTALIIPSRIVLRFLEPRIVSEEEARSEAFREQVRAEAAEHLERLNRETGPRL
jgi:1-acyl-sn-glycerol-3-phosphate acyltransferase